MGKTPLIPCSLVVRSAPSRLGLFPMLPLSPQRHTCSTIRCRVILAITLASQTRDSISPPLVALPAGIRWIREMPLRRARSSLAKTPAMDTRRRVAPRIRWTSGTMLARQDRPRPRLPRQQSTGRTRSTFSSLTLTDASTTGGTPEVGATGKPGRSRMRILTSCSPDNPQFSDTTPSMDTMTSLSAVAIPACGIAGTTVAGSRGRKSQVCVGI
jgi:hypothetical protein